MYKVPIFVILTPNDYDFVIKLRHITVSITTQLTRLKGNLEDRNNL